MKTIVNTYDQLNAAVDAGTIDKHRAVAVCYHARASGRMGWGESSRAMVFSPFFTVDPEAHFSDYGRKAFSLMGKTRRQAIEDAKAWASEKFKIKAWSRNRIGDWVPAEVQKKHPIPKRPQA